jgi:MFS superfamily sulfate permease-like transporter
MTPFSTTSQPMAQHKVNQDSPISNSLHPRVNMAIIGLVLMFVAAVWMFFDSDAYGAWLDVVVTGLFVIAIAIPVLCWLTWRRNAAGARDDSHPGFHDWVVGEFDTWTGPVKSANATIEILLPIAAVAVGMTVLGLLFHIMSSGAA